MTRYSFSISWSIGLALTLAMGLAGPLHQMPCYHAFADQSVLWGLPHGRDVWSNLGFALAGLWGWWRLAPLRKHPDLTLSWAGYRLFLLGLLLTALGSGYYHLAPDNARLLWDRLPIALTCAGLLAGVWADTHRRSSVWPCTGWAVFAFAGVGWWWLSERLGSGDLRPYLLLQALCMLLIPVWQYRRRSPLPERRAFGAALALYALAKLAEMQDHAIAHALGGTVSGHTLKHVLAAAAATLIVATLVRRFRAKTDKTATRQPLAQPHIG